MKWPPMVLYMKIRNQKTDFGLWIPLFLIGPILMVFLLAVLLVILPFVLVALIIAGLAAVLDWQTQWLKKTVRYARWVGYALKSIPAFIRVLCSVPGLEIDIDGKKETVMLTFH